MTIQDFAKKYVGKTLRFWVFNTPGHIDYSDGDGEAVYVESRCEFSRLDGVYELPGDWLLEFSSPLSGGKRYTEFYPLSHITIAHSDPDDDYADE